jgi:tetratricopeptide (TPR) repeat protein
MSSRSLSRSKIRAPAPAEQRLRGMAAVAATHLRKAAAALQAGDLPAAELAVFAARVVAPDHPESLRWAAAVLTRQQRHAEAAACLTQALQALPDDVEMLIEQSVVANELAEHDTALLSLRQAASHAGDSATWMKLSLEFDRQGYQDDALACADRVLQVEPANVPAMLQRGRCLHALGNTDSASAQFRAVMRRAPDSAAAWFSLLDQKTPHLDAAELDRLARLEGRSAHGPEDQALLSFALGKACEDAGRLDEAFQALARANQAVRRQLAWDAAGHSRHVDAVQQRFSEPLQASGSGQGREVIFVVGLPRSGTTLTEQVLAAHPQVEGASELPYLYRVIGEESARRKRPFPEWVNDASAEDWQRLGARYLHLSARWRSRKPSATDKLPANWLLAGAALAMLPEARVIAMHRDPIETCWSCYKQLFGKNQVAFAYDLPSIAAYWHDYSRLVAFWSRRHPTRFRIQHYEASVADPEEQTRALLAFCDLPFDAACLRYHEAQRSVRTASAAQVRQPLRKDTARTAAYGPLLDPLRELLAGSERPASPPEATRA